MRESAHVMPELSDIVAVDLFCGAAGLSLGLKDSGIKIAAGIDLDPACRYPFEQNIGAEFLEQDVAALQPSHVQKLFGDAKIRLLAGCAPCQPFSGYTTRRRSIDRRWQLLLEFLRLTESLRPEIVTLENVPRLIHLPLWRRFVLGLEASSYRVAWDVLDAADYGVPQNRRRLVLLASRLGDIGLPQPRGTDRPTVRTAIGKLPTTKAGKPGKPDPLHSSRALTERNLRRIRASRPAELGKSGLSTFASPATKAKPEKPIRLSTVGCHGISPRRRSPPNSMVLEMVASVIPTRIEQLRCAKVQSSNRFLWTSILPPPKAV